MSMASASFTFLLAVGCLFGSTSGACGPLEVCNSVSDRSLLQRKTGQQKIKITGSVQTSASAQTNASKQDPGWQVVFTEQPGAANGPAFDMSPERTLDFPQFKEAVAGHSYEVKLQWPTGFVTFVVPETYNIFTQVHNPNIPIQNITTSSDFLPGLGSTGWFCHACVTGGLKWGDTCWAVLPLNDENRKCGCSSGKATGTGIYYGGNKHQNRCRGRGGGFAGPKLNNQRRGNLSSIGLTFSIKLLPTTTTEGTCATFNCGSLPSNLANVFSTTVTQENCCLPSGSNMAPPPGYVAKPDSGSCTCQNSGYGLESCGALCCAASPYTDPDPQGQYYYKKQNPDAVWDKVSCYTLASGVSTTTSTTAAYTMIGEGWCQSGVGPNPEANLCATNYELGGADGVRGSLLPENPSTCSKFDGEGYANPMSIEEAEAICNAEPNCAGFTTGSASSSPFWQNNIRLNSAIVTYGFETGLQCWKKTTATTTTPPSTAACGPCSVVFSDGYAPGYGDTQGPTDTMMTMNQWVPSYNSGISSLILSGQGCQLQVKTFDGVQSYIYTPGVYNCGTLPDGSPSPQTCLPTGNDNMVASIMTCQGIDVTTTTTTQGVCGPCSVVFSDGYAPGYGDTQGPTDTMTTMNQWVPSYNSGISSLILSGQGCQLQAKTFDGVQSYIYTPGVYNCGTLPDGSPSPQTCLPTGNDNMVASIMTCQAGVPVSVDYTLVNQNQDCQPSTDWYGMIGMSACSSTCKSQGYAFFLNAPDNNCKCCATGYATNDADNFDVYHIEGTTPAYTLVNQNQDCQPSTDWYGMIGMPACSSTCKDQGYSFFLNAPDNNCKCCSDGYSTNDADNFNVYQIA